jgi:hypothetical protein
MPYNKTIWTEATPINVARLQNMEDGIESKADENSDRGHEFLTNGYANIHGGFCIRWGVITGVGGMNPSKSATFAEPFPIEALTAIATAHDSSTSGTSVSSVNRTTIIVNCSATQEINVFYIAIGH